MNAIRLLTWSLVAWLLPCPGLAQVSIHAQSVAQFSTELGEMVVYTVRTTQPGALSFEVLTADGDLVRRFAPGSDAAAGDHQFSWDGRDDHGRLVPDEAYCVRATLQGAFGRVSDEPCRRSGGEVIAGMQGQVAENGEIGYALSRPSRVLIRVGVKGGAMMRSLAVWRPRPQGRNVERWTGFDESGRIDVRGDRLALLVSAFALPDFSVITLGQERLDYRAWRLAQGWPEQADKRIVPSLETPMERKGQRISKHYYSARYRDREPRISVQLLDATSGQALSDRSRVPELVRVVVGLHPDDQWLMQEQLYEVGYFLNGDFVAEEENGYVPIAWLWNTSNLPAGRHVLTVNLTGFAGRVGTKSVELNK